MLVHVGLQRQTLYLNRMVKNNTNADFPGIKCSRTDSILLNSGCKCRGRTGGTGDDEGGEELHDRCVISFDGDGRDLMTHCKIPQ